MTIAAVTDKRRSFGTAPRKPRGKSQHVIIEAKGVDTKRGPWLSAFRAANIPDGPKAVGFTMSTYGNNDGSRIFPGNERLAADHHCNELTIRRHIAVLVKTGWIRKTSEHKAGVNREFADEYQLTIPDLALPIGDPDALGADGWHLREPEDDLDWPESDLYTSPDDHCTNLIGPLDKDVQPPTHLPIPMDASGSGAGTATPGPGGPRITADAATAKGVTESPITRTKRPTKKTASKVTPEQRAECNRYVALIPRLDYDDIIDALNDLYDAKYGIWEWAHDEMRKQYNEATSKEADVGDPETLEKARFMLMKALRCSSRNPALEECLTDPLDAVDD